MGVLLVISIGLLLVLAFLDHRLFAILLLIAFISIWIRIIHHGYVTALSVFMALMPLWVFLKWVEWPSVIIAGSTLHLATVTKEIVMLVFFLHWLLFSSRSDRVVVRLTPAIIGFFAIVLVGLSQAGLPRYPLLLRPYVETFLLIGVPLLSIDLTERDIERLLIGAAIGGGLAAAVALYHAFIDPQFLLSPELVREDIYKTRGGLSAYFGPRLQSFTGNPNNLGMLMLITGVTSFGLTLRGSFRENMWNRGMFAGIFILSTTVLMLTRSRDDIGFLAVAIMLFILIQRRRLPLLFGGAAFGLGVVLNLDQILNTFGILLSQGNPRFGLWLSGIQFYGWDLLHGVGNVDNQFTTENPYDSTYFRILLQVGIGGLATFLFINLRVFQELFRSLYIQYDQTQAILLILLITILGSFLFGVSLLVFPFSLFYWFVLALALRTLTGDDKEVKSPTKKANPYD